MNKNSNSLKNHNTIVESAAEENEEIGKLNLPVNDLDHIQGPRTAPVNLVEYGEIQKRLGNELLFVFRNFPLREIHPHAQHAAEAAEAAAAQGRFWDMHDYLFEHQRALDDNHLLKYAATLGVDTDKFRKECLDTFTLLRLTNHSEKVLLAVWKAHLLFLSMEHDTMARGI